ncbi:glycosyltransferase, partial [Intestinibacter sp.]|uniref:glycosyltransferase n=1 Tax=Intestinibacter sp. TaxID=1965304 RepID=UPI002A9129D6
MSEPIRVLQVVTYMGRGGLETMLMNYYRNIDRDKVQFDFLTHRDERWDYDDEIESLGGKIYHLPKLNPFSKSYLNALDKFFKEHKEYQIVHCHQDCLSGVVLKVAKKNGVKFTIAHSHNANQDKNLKYLIKVFEKRKIPKYSDELFACGYNSGKWMF